jgi:hypothetical protein
LKTESFHNETTLLNDEKTLKKVQLNHRRNKKQDNTEELDSLADTFNYEEAKGEYWNPEEFSLLYGTPLWDQSTPHQKKILNHLYWVGYYSQIISAEIATIYLNQTSAAGLYGIEDFKIVCDTLDLESQQERTHINTFKKVSEEVEKELFGKRIFTYPMKNFATETMIFQDTNKLKEQWKRFQLHSFSQLSSSNAFIASQYLTVRGMRTLNGKIIQHQLAQFYQKHEDKQNAPIPAKISHHHFLDESYHFNSSTLIGHEVVKSLKPPTKFEKTIANMAIKGCQKDHSNFNCSVNGIFWYEPAIFQTIYKVLRSKHFNLEHRDALLMMEKCFCQENKGIELAHKTHKVASESYEQYLSGLDFITSANKKMNLMKESTIERYIKTNTHKFNQFKKKVSLET